MRKSVLLPGSRDFNKFAAEGQSIGTYLVVLRGNKYQERYRGQICLSDLDTFV